LIIEVKKGINSTIKAILKICIISCTIHKWCKWTRECKSHLQFFSHLFNLSDISYIYKYCFNSIEKIYSFANSFPCLYWEAK
jgi:hypothetical protein